MTDLLNGKIDFFGFEVNPKTTMQEFEAAIGDKFTKKERINKLNGNKMTTYTLNGDIGVWEFIENDTRFAYELYEMKFLNVVLDFSQDRIWMIKLITNMVSFVDDAEGKRHYSDEKVNTRLALMNEWTIKVLGEPNSRISTNSALWYEFDWGKIQPSPWGDSGNAKLYIYYKK